MTAVVRPRRFVEPSALPGFGPALGFTMVYLSFFLLLPLAALVLRPWEHGFGHVWSVITERRTLDALKLSFGAAFLAACTQDGRQAGYATNLPASFGLFYLDEGPNGQRAPQPPEADWFLD